VRPEVLRILLCLLDSDRGPNSLLSSELRVLAEDPLLLFEEDGEEDKAEMKKIGGENGNPHKAVQIKSTNGFILADQNKGVVVDLCIHELSMLFSIWYCVLLI